MPINVPCCQSKARSCHGRRAFKTKPPFWMQLLHCQRQRFWWASRQILNWLTVHFSQFMPDFIREIVFLDHCVVQFYQPLFKLIIMWWLESATYFTMISAAGFSVKSSNLKQIAVYLKLCETTRLSILPIIYFLLLNIWVKEVDGDISINTS